MPLSTVLGAQSLVQPAVCTTATRPASPYTGQAIYDTTLLQALVWNGIVWASVSPTAPTTAFTSGTQTTASTSYVGLTTATAVTVTTGTSALILAYARLTPDREAVGYLSFAVSGATTVASSDNYMVSFSDGPTGGYYGGTCTLAYVITGLTAGSNVFTMQYKSNSGAATIYITDRRITVFPL